MMTHSAFDYDRQPLWKPTNRQCLMSALQKSAMSARVAALPRQQPPPPQARAPWAFPEVADDDEEDEEGDGLGDLPPMRVSSGYESGH
jgi:hypothetical protein